MSGEEILYDLTLFGKIALYEVWTFIAQND